MRNRSRVEVHCKCHLTGLHYSGLGKVIQHASADLSFWLVLPHLTLNLSHTHEDKQPKFYMLRLKQTYFVPGGIGQ